MIPHALLLLILILFSVVPRLPTNSAYSFLLSSLTMTALFVWDKPIDLGELR